MPASSHSQTPWPRTNATGWRAYVFITWLMHALPKCKTAAQAAVPGNLSTLAQGGERLPCVVGQRMLRVALDEVGESGGRARALAERGARQRGAEQRV